MAHKRTTAASAFYNLEICLAHGDKGRQSDRVHDLASQSDGASNKRQDALDQWGMGGGYKGIPQFCNKRVCFFSLNPESALLVLCLLTPYPQGPSRERWKKRQLCHSDSASQKAGRPRSSSGGGFPGVRVRVGDGRIPGKENHSVSSTA